jgi:hypothetical protein
VTIASVTGAVGSVTGNVGGNVTGSVGSVAAGGISSASFTAGAIDATAIAANAIGSSELDASAVTEIQSGLSTLTEAAVRSAVGLASANLDTQIAAVQADADNIQTRLPAALVSGRMDASVGAMAADTVTASALAADAGTEMADAIFKRDMSAVTGEAARSLLNAIRKLMNKWSISGSTLTVCKEDDTTTAYTQAVTSDAAADPITALDTV